MTPPEIPRILLDTSVVLAGVSSSKGASHAILLLGRMGLLELLLTPYILAEVERNVQTRLQKALPLYESFKAEGAWIVVSDPPIEQVQQWAQFIRAKDAPVLATLKQAQPYGLVTLDVKDFLANPQVMGLGLKIMRPGELMIELRSLIATHLSST
jgi:predicted nucleic acid-binding protein